MTSTERTLTLAVTGANGFIGQRVVATALTRGFQVRALVRSPPPAHWAAADPSLAVVRTELRDPESLATALQGCDGIVHLAAAMSGPDARAQTLTATDTLLQAAEAAGVDSLVGVSSLSVLDCVRKPADATIDEHTPENPHAHELGEYARTKRDQELRLREWHEGSEDRSLALVRPGLVYDHAHLPTAHAGFFAAGVGLTVMHGGQVPVAHLHNVASAIVSAARLACRCPGQLSTFHVVDDDLPRQSEYLRQLAARGQLPRLALPLPWRVYSALALEVRTLLSVLGQRRRVPDSFRKNSVCARQKPFVFSNIQAKRMLDWVPSASFRSTFAHEQPGQE